MTVLTIGILPYEEMKARTLAIARGEIKPDADDPNVGLPSTETLGRILSEPNRALLAEIARSRPTSLAELAAMTGRKPSNLSRTLKTMALYGLVSMTKDARGRLRPEVRYDSLEVRVPITGGRRAA